MRLTDAFLTPDEVLVRGFRYIKALKDITTEDWTEWNIKTFKQHYGPSPTIISFIWSDIITTEIDLAIAATDKGEKGFRKLLQAFHFLWAYPKNTGLFASTMGTNKRYVEGENLWIWVRAIAKLKALKIVWPEDDYNDPNRIYIVTVDGVDFKVWEKQHPEFPYDKGQYSHKHNHGALKYEIAIDTVTSKVVWINGPFRGGMHDKSIYLQGLRTKIPNGKMIIADGVYGSKTRFVAPDDHLKISLPNLCDTKEVHNFKSRLRARHESFNGRLKHWRSLADTFHHANNKHVHVFEAIAVIIQYQMDHGSPLFDA